MLLFRKTEATSFQRLRRDAGSRIPPLRRTGASARVKAPGAPPALEGSILPAKVYCRPIGQKATIAVYEHRHRRKRRQGENHQQISRGRLQGHRVLRPCARSAGEGRVRPAGPGFRDELGGRVRFPEGRQRDRQGGEGLGAADPRDRPGSRRRGDFLAPVEDPGAEARC